MSIVLATLVLNEMEWLPKLYLQHRGWPGLVKWVFVESADEMYAGANPNLVSPDGLSTDGTTDYLRDLAKMDPFIQHIPFGFSQSSDPAQGKCEARTQYLKACESVEPDFVGVVDADEFYPRRSQQEINAVLRLHPRGTAFVFRHRETWRPPSLADRPLFEWEAVGGFWGIPYCRWWRWQPGLRYWGNHNTPETPEGVGQDRKTIRLDRQPNTPEMIHLGFSASLQSRQAKHAYYSARGEGVTDRRAWYVESRRLWETWTPRTRLPRGAQIIPYQGPIPEVFRPRQLEYKDSLDDTTIPAQEAL